MPIIKKIFAREILDSRGHPTVETEVTLESGIRAMATVPSGASVGSYEDLELRDNDLNRYDGLGVLKAVENVNKVIQPALIGIEASNQKKIDGVMLKIDGTENESNLGANAILSVSLAICRAVALGKNIPLYQHFKETFGFKFKSYRLPTPMFNIFNGGKHSDSGLSIQEYKIIPTNISTFKEQLRAGSEIFHKMKKILISEGQSVAVGDEGGFAPKLESNARALGIMDQAIEEAGYKQRVNIGIDAAASSFFNANENQYMFKPENVNLSREMLVNIYAEWIQKYNIISVEDGLDENDWEGWKAMNEKIGEKVMIIGDDLLVTKTKRLKLAIKERACNTVLIKLNQAGTLWETIETIKLAQKNKMKIVISHRSGETTDDLIADLAVGVGADYTKAGSLSRGERICKYNRLLRIEEELI